MRQHERVTNVRAAEIDLLEKIVDFEKAHADKLTTAELLQVLNDVLSRTIASVLKYAIREERHGDPNKPGDAA